MAIESTCTGCGQKLNVGDEHAGKKARCPACGQVFVVNPTGPADSATEPSGSDNAFGLDSNPESASANEVRPGDSDQFYMQAPDGNVYGPVDRETLNRWYQEGRVAANYMIRQGEAGSWLPAATFQPQQAAASGNPYASTTAPGAMGMAANSYPKSDQSGIILAMGILSFFLCGIFGIVAWVMGHKALNDIQAGLVDPANKSMTQVGYYLGMVSVLLHLVCGTGYIAFIAISHLSQL